MTLKEIGLIGAGAAAAIAAATVIGAGDVPNAEFEVGGDRTHLDAVDCLAVKTAIANTKAWSHGLEALAYASLEVGCILVSRGTVVAPMSEPPDDAKSVTAECIEALKAEAATP